MSIRKKLTIMFLTLALIPVGFVSVLTFHNYRDSLEASRLSGLEDIAAFKADKIETYFRDLKIYFQMSQAAYVIKKNLPVLIRLAGDPADQEFIAAKEMVDQVYGKLPASLGLRNIMLTDLKGRIVYSGNPGYLAKAFLNFLPDPQQKAFSEGKNKIYFSDIFVHKPYNDKPTMFITGPANDLSGNLTGVIAAEVDMSPVYKMIQDTTGLGNTGETLIGKKAGSRVIFLNPLRNDPNSALKKSLKIGERTGYGIQEAVQGKTGSGEFIDYRGKQVIGAWRYVPSLDWGIVAKIDTQEAFAVIANLRNLVLIILVIIFVLAGIISFSIAQSISSPIKELSKGAQIVGGGNLDYKVSTDAKDEVGQLSRAFDKMTQDLKLISSSRDAERKRLYDVLETLPVFVVLLSEDHQVLFANKLYRESFGDQGGKCCYERLFKRIEPCENCETYKVLETNAAHHWGWTGPDGRNYDNYVFPFTDTDGSRVILEMGVDITERMNFESELKKHRDHLEILVKERTSELQVILDSVPAMIFYKDKENHFIRTNKAFETAMGLSKEKLQGASLFDLYPKEQAQAFWEDDLEVIKSAKAKLGIVETMDSTHDRWILQTDKIPYFDEQGSVSGVIGFSIDITERIRAEEELQKNEQRLSRAQEIAHLGSWELDLVNNKLSWSDEVYRIFGLKPQEFAATYEAFLGAVHPDDRQFVNETYSESLRLEKDNYEIEHRVIRKSTGEVRIVHEKCQHLRDTSGKVIRSIGMVHDITERKKAEEELRRSNENLEQFAYVASHDLQEPLRAMASYSQLLERRYKNKLDQDANDFIGYIVEAANRMQKLINDLLDYSRIGRKDGFLTEVDCNQVLRKVLEGMSATIESNRAKVAFELLPVFEGYESSFVQLFQNLIGNALKFRGKEPPRIHISAEKYAQEWVFCVKDNGIGIEQQYQERIFQIFQRLHSRNEYPGTGIGLSICKKIVESYGGKIWVELELEKGSSFYFSVPIKGGKNG